MSTIAAVARPPSSEDIPLEDFKVNGSTSSRSELPTLRRDAAVSDHGVDSVLNGSPRGDPEMSTDEEARSQLAVSLPPIDGGKRAW